MNMNNESEENGGDNVLKRSILCPTMVNKRNKQEPKTRIWKCIDAMIVQAMNIFCEQDLIYANT